MEARTLFDSCNWTTPNSDQSTGLVSPPTSKEIEARLLRANNTSPGIDKLEYRHLRLLDSKGHLLEKIFATVWTIGIPDIWRHSRTVSIYKKGDTAELSNFRPISLLSTMYKLLSGIISHRLSTVAVDLGWISPEQKGFLPGANGIQEHTQLLQTIVEETKLKKGNMSMAFLDLCNAFGSIPHMVIGELFSSLPVPEGLRSLIMDIYSNNRLDFAIGPDTVPIYPTAGVRQGDPLSSIVFNLAAEPLL